ncbi:hypothetical protein [Streptomyces goshikiensis]
MTGPEHYRKAEQQLQFALDAATDAAAETHCAIAQVHATLALAAATALSTAVEADIAGYNVEECDAWHVATSAHPGGGR